MFNTHLAVDLFDNESELVYDLSYKGKVAWDNIWNTLSEVSDISLNATLYDGMYGVDVSYGYYLTGDASGNKNISRQLLGQIISSSPSRLQNLNNYVIDSSKGIFSIPFISGDSISFKLILYTSPNQHLIVNRTTPIPPRTYQIRINLKESVSKSNIHADGVNVIVTDISPPLYNNVSIEDDLNNNFLSNYQDPQVYSYSGYYDGNINHFETASLLYLNPTNDFTNLSTITQNKINYALSQSLKVSWSFKASKTGTYRFFTGGNGEYILEIDGDDIIVKTNLINQNNFANKSLIGGSYYSFNLYYGIPPFYYPPSLLINNTTNLQNNSYGNGDYVVSFSSQHPGRFARDLFTGVSGGNWRPSHGFHINAWVQLEFPSAIVLYSYQVNTLTGTGSGVPKRFKLEGSNDNFATRVLLNERSWGINQRSATIVVNNPFNLSFKYYRLTNLEDGHGTSFIQFQYPLIFYEKPYLSYGYLEPDNDGINSNSINPDDFIKFYN